MPIIAFSLYAIQIGFLLGFRCLRHQRKYGRFGLANELAPNLVGGGGILLAGIFAAIAPLLQYVGLVPEVGSPLIGLGSVIWLLGLLGALWSQDSMGSSWRFGVEHNSQPTKLVTTGPFRWVRNPIYSFDVLSLLGIALICPNFATFFAIILVQFAFAIQVLKVEEPHLVRVFGRSYLLWASRTGLFWPGIGKFARTVDAD